MSVFTGEELSTWSRGEWYPSPPSRVAGFSIDTRTLKTGNIFVALEGESSDGHDFVEEAIRNKGAVGAIVREGSRDCFPGVGRLLRVRDTLAALQDIAAGYRRSLNAETIAVTGSVGKTTVKEMIAGILSRHCATAYSPGNWNNHIGVPLSILGMGRDTQVGVFEVGMNHPGEIAPLSRLIDPLWGVVTNVGEAHLEFFDSVSDIAKEKCEMLKALPEHGVAVLNNDGDFIDMLKDSAHCRVLTVSRGGQGDYVARKHPSEKRCVVVSETQTGDTVDVRMPRPGDHVVDNMLLACAVARGHGASWEDIQCAIENCDTLPMRWAEQTVVGVKIINDAYNANPMSMHAAIDAFDGIAVSGRKWLVLGGMLELGDTTSAQHAEVGRLVARTDCVGLIVVGDLGEEISAGALDAGYDKQLVCRCMTNEEAAEVLAGRVRSGDAILLKASRAMHFEELETHLTTLLSDQANKSAGLSG